MLIPHESTIVCDNCFVRVKEAKQPDSWQTTWLFPALDEEDAEPEGRVDACSEPCVHELQADGMWESVTR